MSVTPEKNVNLLNVYFEGLPSARLAEAVGQAAFPLDAGEEVEDLHPLGRLACLVLLRRGNLEVVR